MTTTATTTKERKEMTLGKLIEQPLTLQAFGYLMRLTHQYKNNPCSINQIMDLFDDRANSHLSNAEKHDIIDELVAHQFIHRYAFLGSLRYQSTLTLRCADNR